MLTLDWFLGFRDKRLSYIKKKKKDNVATH